MQPNDGRGARERDLSLRCTEDFLMPLSKYVVVYSKSEMAHMLRMGLGFPMLYFSVDPLTYGTAMGKLTDLLELAQSRLSTPAFAGLLTPSEAHEVWQLAPGARLIDLRTRAELDWVGRIPGALEIEWTRYPSGALNEHFLAQLKRQAESDALLIFLCRCGLHAPSAALLATQNGYTTCYGVLEGFEGELDAHQQRNKTGGWRYAGLPWRQS